MSADEAWAVFAEGNVECPACSQAIPVPVLARLLDVEDGRQQMETTPDLTELWSHTWTHQEQP